MSLFKVPKCLAIPKFESEEDSRMWVLLPHPVALVIYHE